MLPCDMEDVRSCPAKGMGITFREMMQPTVTDLYPDAPPRLEQRYRGVHVLQRDASGVRLENCRSELGLNRPAIERYAAWAGAANSTADASAAKTAFLIMGVSYTPEA